MTERRVFTYKDVEEAKGWIGKEVVFNDLLSDIDSGRGYKGTLGLIERNEYPFLREEGEYWQFFSPEPEPVENWVPFTAEDWQLFHGKAVHCDDWDDDCGATVIGWTRDWIEIKDRDEGWDVKFKDFLANWTFVDGTRCGKKVTE